MQGSLDDAASASTEQGSTEDGSSELASTEVEKPTVDCWASIRSACYCRIKRSL